MNCSMVNQRELSVIEEREQDGWKTIRGGSLDFLFVKVLNGKIVEFEFLEVKSPSDRLSYNQAIWRQVLESLGAKFTVREVQ